MEMSCDERVLRELGTNIRGDYGKSLLSLTTGTKLINASPLAFGESKVKSRIKNVLNYKKPTFWMIGLTTIAMVIVSVGLLSNPQDTIGPSDTVGTNVVSQISPDGRYRAENYGADEIDTSSGIIPSEGIRLVEISSGKVLWDMKPGYYDCTFLWSSNSQYLAVSYMARNYEETTIVRIADFSEISVPLPEEVQENLHEYRSDIYQKGTEWIDNSQLSISIEWIGKDNITYSGRYAFNPITGEITDIEIDEGIIPG